MLERIALITGNAGKAAEYAAMLGIDVNPAKAELTEVQSLDVAVVVARRAADAYAQLGEPAAVNVKPAHDVRALGPWPVRGRGPRPWPSVKQPTVRTDRPGGTHARPLCVRGHRNTAVYSATR
jgi:hypothetical protein